MAVSKAMVFPFSPIGLCVMEAAHSPRPMQFTCRMLKLASHPLPAPLGPCQELPSDAARPFLAAPHWQPVTLVCVTSVPYRHQTFTAPYCWLWEQPEQARVSRTRGAGCHQLHSPAYEVEMRIEVPVPLLHLHSTFAGSQLVPRCACSCQVRNYTLCHC